MSRSTKAELLDTIAAQTLALADANAQIARLRAWATNYQAKAVAKIKEQDAEIERLRATRGKRPAYKHQPSAADIASHEAFVAKREALRAHAKLLGHSVTAADLN